eukprot:UN18975
MKIHLVEFRIFPIFLENLKLHSKNFLGFVKTKCK